MPAPIDFPPDDPKKIAATLRYLATLLESGQMGLEHTGVFRVSPDPSGKLRVLADLTLVHAMPGKASTH